MTALYGVAGLLVAGRISFGEASGAFLVVLFLAVVASLVVGGIFAGRRRRYTPAARRPGTRENAYLKQLLAARRGDDAGRMPLAERLSIGEGAEPEGPDEEALAPDRERLGEKTRGILGASGGDRAPREHPTLPERGLELRARGHYRMP